MHFSVAASLERQTLLAFVSCFRTSVPSFPASVPSFPASPPFPGRFPAAQVAAFLHMTPPGVGYAVEWGEAIAREKGHTF
jgi:hypothetical protein